MKCSTPYPVPTLFFQQSRCRDAVNLQSYERPCQMNSEMRLWRQVGHRKRRHRFAMMCSDLLERCDCQENCWRSLFLFSCSIFGYKLTKSPEKLCGIIHRGAFHRWPHLSHLHHLREHWDCTPNRIRYWDENRVYITTDNLLDAGISRAHTSLKLSSLFVQDHYIPIVVCRSVEPVRCFYWC